MIAGCTATNCSRQITRTLQTNKQEDQRKGDIKYNSGVLNQWWPS